MHIGCQSGTAPQGDQPTNIRMPHPYLLWLEGRAPWLRKAGKRRKLESSWVFRDVCHLLAAAHGQGRGTFRTAGKDSRRLVCPGPAFTL